MKKHLKNLILLVASAGLFASITPTMTANAKTKYYTNPYTLRHHKYWYSCQQDYNGNWNYSRLHFAKHSVFLLLRPTARVTGTTAISERNTTSFVNITVGIRLALEIVTMSITSSQAGGI